MSTASAVQLSCPECRHENEAERVYCHECGARLDRSPLASHKGAKPETPEQIHKRMRSLFARRQFKARLFLIKAAKLIVAAAAASVAFEMLIAPDLPETPKSAALPPQISLNLERLTQSRQPPLLRYSEEEVNGYIGNIVKNKKDKLNHPLINFERAVVLFSEDNCRVTIERSIFGYSIYTSGTYSVQADDGKLNVSTRGGAIGRLPIHPYLMQYGGLLFGDAVALMDRERKLLARVGSIQMHEKEVSLTATP